MTDPFRQRMVVALAEFLAIPEDRASAAMNHIWEATKDYRGQGGPPRSTPDPADPGHALAHRIQMMLEREFDGEEAFPCVVTVQDNRTRRVGIAISGIPWDEAEPLLRLGMGTVRRQHRQYGEPV